MIRAARPDEQRFIASSWVASYAESDFARQLARADYFAGQNRLVDAILARASVRVDERDDIIAGWACTEGADVVHYVYVRQLYRREGVARGLLEEHLARACRVSHRMRGREPLPKGWRYNPFDAWSEGVRR